MYRQIKKFLFLSLVLLTGNITIYAQNPGELHATIKKNTVLSLEISSQGTPIIAKIPESANNPGDPTLTTVVNLFPGYEVQYQPYTDFVGQEYFVIEYYKPGNFPGIYLPAYTVVHVKVLESIVVAEDDFISLDDLNSSADVNVLDNDSSDGGDLEIAHIAQSMNCTVSINVDSTLNVSIDPSFSGMAYVKYSAKNAEGGVSTATLNVKCNGGEINVPDTITYYLCNEHPLELLFGEDGYDVDPNDLPSLGSVNVSSSDRVTYVADEDVEGLESFMLTNGANSKLINIYLLDREDSDLVVVDDHLVTSMGNAITFNPVSNDHRSYPIIDHSPELQKDAQGNLTFTPDPNVIADYEFYYTVNVNNGSSFHTGKIFIKIDGFLPQTFDWELSTPMNVSRVLEYDLPIEGYEINVLSPPIHGSLDVHHGLDTVTVECDDVEGRELVVYEPDQNFTGTDNFELEFCTTGNPCYILKFDLEVFNNGNDTACHCVNDCIWKGDTNGDGRVSIADVLAVGYNMGAQGDSRTDVAYAEWFGQNGANWNLPGNNNTDVKHADSNGDGVVSEDDLLAIGEHFGALHNITDYEILPLKGFYFNLVPHETELDSGDLAVFDIVLGNTEYPVVDFNGLAFKIGLNPGFVDSSSLNVHFFEQDWFSYLSPTVQMFQSPVDGEMHAAFARSKSLPVSGQGIIGEASFIVEDDYDGFKIEEGTTLIPIVVNLLEGEGIDANGNGFALENSSATIYLKIQEDQESELSSTDLKVFPNPSSDILNIHLNGSALIQEVDLMDVLGRSTINMTNQSVDKMVLSTKDLQNGQYLLRVKTDQGIISKTVQVFNP